MKHFTFRECSIHQLMWKISTEKRASNNENDWNSKWSSFKTHNGPWMDHNHTRAFNVNWINSAPFTWFRTNRKNSIRWKAREEHVKLNSTSIRMFDDYVHIWRTDRKGNTTNPKTDDVMTTKKSKKKNYIFFIIFSNYKCEKVFTLSPRSTDFSLLFQYKHLHIHVGMDNITCLKNLNVC